MEFEQVIETQKTKLAVVAPIETEPVPVVLTDRDIPAGMPRTNRLDKLTTELAVWAIRNGDAWLAYLKANGGEIVEHTGASVQPIEVSPAEVYTAICDTLENVWLSLTGNMKRRDLVPSSLNEWCDTLQWALAVFPKKVYEGPRRVIEAELDTYQALLP